MGLPRSPPSSRMLVLIVVAVSCVMDARAQTGTLQMPAKPQTEAPATSPNTSPPSAAPRQPVRPAGPSQAAPSGPASQTAKTTPAGNTSPGKQTAQKPLPLPLPPPPPPPPPEAAKPAETADPASKADADKKDGTKPRLPRFVSLRSDEVNLRVGPGSRYPIDWVYKRRDLPVRIEREFDVWRLIRDHEGNRGWVNQATLTGRRTFLVIGGDATLRAEAKDTAAAVAVLQAGVIGRLRSCDAASNWCQVQTATHRGFLRRDQFWGALPGEAVSP